MAVSAARTIGVNFSGSIQGNESFPAVTNTTSIGMIQTVALTTGANTITVPSVTGFTVVGVTIIPPAGNTQTLTLKGVTGDTGVPLHLTDPSSLGLATTASTFVITAGAAVNGVRLVWS